MKVLLAAVAAEVIASVAAGGGLIALLDQPDASKLSQENSVVSQAERLLDRHAETCWQGRAPADVEIPGHVIWQHPDGTADYSKALVGPALDTLFGTGRLQGTAIAFCR